MSTVLAFKDMIEFAEMTIEQLAREIQSLRAYHVSLKDVAEKCQVSRATVSNFVNRHQCTLELQNKVIAYLTEFYNANSVHKEFHKTIKLFSTAEFESIIGFCEDMRVRKKMGVIIGHPGTGKTTAIKEYVKQTEEAIYIEAFSNMRLSDLLEIIADKAGVELCKGSGYRKTQHIIRVLAGKDLVLLIDEAEYLKKWDVEKFEVLRKIWDNTDISIILCGTHELEEIVTRGNGKSNLAQLYRRKYMMKLKGISEKEVRLILKSYNVDKDAETLLAKIATDVRHGGMGNFVEILELSLETTKGDVITGSVVKDAMNYKMMY